MWQLGKKSPDYQPPEKPFWLKWLLLAFIGYAVFVVSMSGDDSPNRLKKAFQQSKQSLSQHEMLNLEGYRNKCLGKDQQHQQWFDPQPKRQSY